MQGDVDVDPLEVVLGRTEDAQDRCAGGRRGRGAPLGQDAPAAGQVLRGEGAVGAQQLLQAADEDHLAPPLPGAGAHVQHQVGRPDHLRVVLHHQEGVARVAQPVQDADEPADVARVQPDGGLVQHEQGVHQGGAQGRGQVDALHLPAAQGAGLAVEGQVAEPDVRQVAQAGADLARAAARRPRPAGPEGPAARRARGSARWAGAAARGWSARLPPRRRRSRRRPGATAAPPASAGRRRRPGRCGRRGTGRGGRGCASCSSSSPATRRGASPRTIHPRPRSPAAAAPRRGPARARPAGCRAGGRSGAGPGGIRRSSPSARGGSPPPPGKAPRRG